MKKQLLIMITAFFLVSIFQSNAQVILTPTPLGECIDLDDPLNVVAGHEYTYEVEVPAPPGAKNYHWLVTQDTDFISNGGLIATAETPGTSSVLASGSSHYNTLTEGENTINLTWKSFVLADTEYVFVVIYVVDADGCSNNLKVYRIRPIHAFTLDLANVDFDADELGGDDFTQCFDEVQTATFDPDFGDDGGVVYDFGQNTLYFVVAAANFSGGYELTVRLDGLQGATPSGALGQQANLYWDYTLAGLAADPNEMSITDGEVSFDVDAQSSPVGTDGEMIFIKVVIDHNSFEGADADFYDYDLSIYGELLDEAGNAMGEDFADIHHDTCDVDPFHDEVTQRLSRRTQVLPVDPDEFLPIAP